MTVPAVEGSVFWTFQAVEERLIEAWGYLVRMPDGEAGWLRAGGKSSMPAFIRETRAGDYFESRPGRPGLRAAQVDLVERVLIGSGAWIEWVVPRDRSLVATVLRLRSRQVGFDWRDVAESERAGVSGEALRKRYSRAVAGIAQRLSRDPSAQDLLA